jgi:hypothetical protein
MTLPTDRIDHQRVFPGDDCVVRFPSGREVEGRFDGFERTKARVWVDDYGEYRVYALNWLHPWEV